ncbi:MAG: HAD hydrolase-like protein [Eubacteriales bacterium]|nr:HAD hydrolase-like protein [Eubacteriales bacterium]
MKFSKIIFDMDGVITTEQAYWTTAALTVKSMLDKGFNTTDPQEIKEIRAEIFQNDDTIRLCKDIGINSNWDLGFVVYVASQLIDTRDFRKVYDYIHDLNLTALDLYKFLEDKGYPRNQGVWLEMQDYFQQWYLGDDGYQKVNGKKPSVNGRTGFMNNEMPMFDPSELKAFFEKLINSGATLAIATGRLAYEVVPAMKRWGLFEYFDERSISTYDYVEKAQVLCDETIAKPHPYCFLKALLGTDYPDEKILSGDYDKTLSGTALAVGDAGADILSAQAGGMSFAAVLTGVAGENAREYFVKQKADYIFDNVFCLTEIYKRR